MTNPFFLNLIARTKPVSGIPGWDPLLILLIGSMHSRSPIMKGLAHSNEQYDSISPWFAGPSHPIVSMLVIPS